MNDRNKPWQIAADLETAAKAILEADRLLDAVHASAQDEIAEIGGTWADMAAELKALSDKYQAIADAEEEL